MLAPSDDFKPVTARDLLAELDYYSAVMVALDQNYHARSGDVWVRISKVDMRYCIKSWNGTGEGSYGIQAQGSKLYVIAYPTDR